MTRDPIDPTRFSASYSPARVALENEADRVVANFNVNDAGWLWVLNWNGKRTYLPEHVVTAVWPCETDVVEYEEGSKILEKTVRLTHEQDLLDAVDELPDDYVPDRLETDHQDDFQEVTP